MSPKSVWAALIKIYNVMTQVSRLGWAKSIVNEGKAIHSYRGFIVGRHETRTLNHSSYSVSHWHIPSIASSFWSNDFTLNGSAEWHLLFFSRNSEKWTNGRIDFFFYCSVSSFSSDGDVRIHLTELKWTELKWAVLCFLWTRRRTFRFPRWISWLIRHLQAICSPRLLAKHSASN